MLKYYASRNEKLQNKLNIAIKNYVPNFTKLDMIIIVIFLYYITIQIINTRGMNLGLHTYLIKANVNNSKYKVAFKILFDK